VTSDRHVPQLDSIRAFAVALVMIHHFTPPEAIHGLPLAALGVQLFFVLSGFLITGILLRARATVESDQQRASVAILKFYARRFLRLMPLFLGGQLKTGNLSTGQNRQFLPGTETGEFYFVASSVRKSVWTLVRQLRGPHLSTCAWWSKRSSRAVTAAVSPRSFPQSSTGRFDVSSVEARS
jgi:Acyltransferase family